MKVVLAYPPFCTPASPPYSITYLYSFLKDNLTLAHEVAITDLNIQFHSHFYSDYAKTCKSDDYNTAPFHEATKDFLKATKEQYRINNQKVLSGELPEHCQDLLNHLCTQKPDVVAFSIVYSSQVHYTMALISELKKKGITTIVGGPSVSPQLSKSADHHLANEVELLEFIEQQKCNHEELKCETVLDYAQLPLESYFVKNVVLPYRSSNTCYYQKCTFCTHHTGGKYFEYSLDAIEQSIKNNNAQFVFFTDDMIHTKRLREIARRLKPLGVQWMCQLRPLKELDAATLKELHEGGLRLVIWGVEAGSQRILDLMQKGTTIEDVSLVLENAHLNGIKNGTYIMFGFPTETLEETQATINFLKKNQESIDIVSTAHFGLQEGAPMLKEPEIYGLENIKLTDRTVLGPKINYESKKGADTLEIKKLVKKNKSLIESINKYPKEMNFFREHMLIAQNSQ